MLIGLHSSTATEVQTRTDSGIFCGGVRIAAASFRVAVRDPARDFLPSQSVPNSERRIPGRETKERRLSREINSETVAN
jgi:hypothetical protein